ncbi:hypothetical protein SDC9_200597 [bioreactor metagenome]|uniref:Uncharacterized protein n=1 Tax=bioreactor metagenome TaxID=1076179 RepID=A0A645IX33_9ZZZZ
MAVTQNLCGNNVVRGKHPVHGRVPGKKGGNDVLVFHRDKPVFLQLQHDRLQAVVCKFTGKTVLPAVGIHTGGNAAAEIRKVAAPLLYQQFGGKAAPVFVVRAHRRDVGRQGAVDRDDRHIHCNIICKVLRVAGNQHTGHLVGFEHRKIFDFLLLFVV